MLQQMTIGKKFAFTSGGLFAGMVLVGVVSIYNLAGLNGTTQQIIADPLPGMARIATARATALTARGDVWRHISEPNPDNMAEIERSVQENRSLSAQALQEYEPTIKTAEDRALYDRLKPAMQKYLDELSGVLELSRAGKSRDARPDTMPKPCRRTMPRWDSCSPKSSSNGPTAKSSPPNRSKSTARRSGLL